MQDLKDFLIQQGYVRVKLKKTITNHFEIKAKINGVKGSFILDTGASKSCVGTENIEFFSRDDSKAGLSLQFDYDLIDGKWNHKGLSSKGDPIHEIWSVRQ